VAARRPGRSECHIAQESRRHAAAAAPLFFFPLRLCCFSGEAEEPLAAASVSQVWAIAGLHLRATAH